MSGFTLSTLSAYTDEQRTQLLTKALFTSKTADLLMSLGNVVTGVKSAEALPILSSTIYFQADACGHTASGDTNITQRPITVGKVKIEDTFCPKDLEAKFTQIGLKAGSPVDMGVFESQIGDEKAGLVAEALEVAIWQGDVDNGTGNNAFWDGFETILSELGFGGAGDPINGNPTSITVGTGFTTSNIDDIIAGIFTLLPDAVLNRSDRFIAMGTDTFRIYRQWLVNANLFHFPPNEVAEMVLVDPLTGVKVHGLPGLTGTNSIIASYWGNFWLGTDMMNEEEQYKFWYSQDDDNVKFRATFKYGTQIAFPAQVVYFTLVP